MAAEGRRPGRLGRRAARRSRLEVLYPAPIPRSVRSVAPGPDFIYTNFLGGRALDFIYTNIRGFFQMKKALRFLRKIMKVEV